MIDEAWALLSGSTADFIEGVAQRRKYNGALITAAQALMIILLLRQPKQLGQIHHGGFFQNAGFIDPGLKLKNALSVMRSLNAGCSHCTPLKTPGQR